MSVYDQHFQFSREELGKTVLSSRRPSGAQRLPRDALMVECTEDTGRLGWADSENCRNKRS